MTTAEYKARLTAAVAQKKNALSELEAAFNRLQNSTHWAELNIGSEIAEGAEVRHIGRYYRCIKAHTKSLLRSPLNGEYWKSEI